MKTNTQNKPAINDQSQITNLNLQPSTFNNKIAFPAPSRWPAILHFNTKHGKPSG